MYAICASFFGLWMVFDAHAWIAGGCHRAGRGAAGMRSFVSIIYSLNVDGMSGEMRLSVLPVGR